MQFVKNLFQRKRSDNDIDFFKSKIDQTRFREIYNKYVDVDPHPGFSKYLDLDQWIGTAIAHYELLRLPPRRPLTILDLGTGAGYFPFVCKHRGHSVTAIDVPGHEFYSEITKLLDVDRREVLITANESLPDLGRRFDLVTAFAICFNNHATQELWGAGEWEFFIHDLLNNILTKEGQAFLKFNEEPNGRYYDDEVREVFESHGATMDRDTITISQ